MKKTIPQKLNKYPYVAGAIHTDPEILPKSILKRHNARYPYNTAADTINDIHQRNSKKKSKKTFRKSKSKSKLRNPWENFNSLA